MSQRGNVRAGQWGVLMSSSYRYDQMRSMGKTNAGWGVCGFTSSLYAMYHLNPTARPRLINAPRPFTVLAEIKTYLEMLYAEGNTDLLDEIERFTRSFGVVDGTDFRVFTPRSYILYVNSAVDKYIDKMSDAVDEAIFNDGKFSIALPPQAVVDYLKRIWRYNAKAEIIDGAGDGIVGVRDSSKDNKDKIYNGLVHYVYRKDQRIYSWGNSFGSLNDADKDFQFCWFIKIDKK
jgi:hypothetical protein